MTSSLAAIHVAKKQLGLDEETYRAKLKVITGKSSAKDMTEEERQKCLSVFRREGFTPLERRPDGRKKLTGKYAPKLQALWIAGYNLGVFHNRDDAALSTFVYGQTKIEEVRWVHHQDDAQSAIEALKAWMAREGGVVWSLSRGRPDWQHADGYKIARAQFAMLQKLDPAYVGFLGLQHWIIAHIDLNWRIETMDTAMWIKAMNALGERVRAAKKAGRADIKTEGARG